MTNIDNLEALVEQAKKEDRDRVFWKNILPELVNVKLHSAELEKQPHRLLSSEIAVRYIYHEPKMSLGFHINSSIADVEKITEQQLYEAAVKNTADSYHLIDMWEIFAQGERGNMLLLTNSDMCFGAAGILQEDVLKQAGRMLGGDFWVIPSSIHEVICVRCVDGGDPEDLRAITAFVNALPGTVASNEVLGEIPFLYDAKEGTLKEVEHADKVPEMQ